MRDRERDRERGKSLGNVEREREKGRESFQWEIMWYSCTYFFGSIFQPLIHICKVMTVVLWLNCGCTLA